MIQKQQKAKRVSDDQKSRPNLRQQQTKFAKNLQGQDFCAIYYELDAHISDLGRSVYETKYLFSLLAAMFISI